MCVRVLTVRERVEECLKAMDSGNGDETAAVMDLIAAICAYYKERLLVSVGI